MKKSLPPIDESNFKRFVHSKTPKIEPSQETCVYNTRSFRVDLKNRLKIVGLTHAKTLEEMVNWAIEVGVDKIEKGEY
jgi:hypothetical protein